MENHQVKSRFYYVFWAIMAAAVVGGQIYVGSGYREMAAQQRDYTAAMYNAQVGWDTYLNSLRELAAKKNYTGQYE